MKNINLGSLSIPITQYASQGNAILGIRDSGKSYTATGIGEQLYAAAIPFVAFDPSGVWKFLRVPGKGPGLPVVVAGGKAPDLPLTPQSAPEIVRAAMRANVSLVVDLYDINMSKADWSRIVEACVRVLLYENGEHGLRHIFIEEAAEFAPQIVQADKAKVYAEVEKLARIGGNALLGYTLINQRAEQVNKAVLELCDCLMLHRQKGKNSIKSLEKWLELSTGGDVKSIIAGLPKLPSGEAWVWPANADHAVHVKMPEKKTFHPDRRALIANPATANVQRIDASKFVTELKGSLDKYIEEAKANDPAELKKRIAALEKELKKPAAKAAPAVDEKAIERARTDGFNAGATHGYQCGWDEHGKSLATALAKIPAQPPKLGHTQLSGGEIPVRASRQAIPQRTAITPSVKTTPRTLESVVKRHTRSNGAGTSLPPGEAAILGACIQYPDGLRREQLTVLTGYKRSTRDAYIQRLREKGFAEAVGDLIVATDAGRDALPDFEPLPTGDELQAYWLNKLPEGEAKILTVLIAAYPDSVSRDDLSNETGFKRSTRDAYVQRMRAKQIVTEGRGEVRASETLF